MFWKPREGTVPSATKSTEVPTETKVLNVHLEVTDDLSKAGF